MSKSPQQLPNVLKRAETNVYRSTGFLSRALYMTLVTEKVGPMTK